ncbi:MAG TPA: M48 family metallopeptidase [Ignavibacteriaceae bacterium]|nr:M48 family metallopeptidase [Ignavibacteriaceae bacterium]
MDSKKYNNTKIFFNIAKGISTFLLILIFVLSGLSFTLQQYLSVYFHNQYILLIAFVVVTGVVSSIIFFPVNYYTDFYLEHKYDLSNQTFIKWILEGAKAILVSTIIGVPVLLLFFFVLNKYNNLWWLPFAIALFVISVILARIVPVIILPLFYKITPIENEELKTRIQNLAKNAGIKVENVYKFNMSKNTKKANAAFTGIGKSKRILLGDNLIDQYTSDEIETVIAHELGHYKRKHIIKNIIIGTVASFLTLFLISYFYSYSVTWFNFSSIKEIAALPLLILWMLLIGLVQTPITNLLSRKFEYEADQYAILSTGKPTAFISTLEKLTEQNLGDKNPHPLIEWFFYSHPSIERRILAIKKYSSLLELNNGIIKDNLTYQGE